MKQSIVLAVLLNTVVSLAQAEAWPYQDAMAEAVDHAVRADTNRERDRYRHPAAVLQFFDVQPQMTLVEIWPATGWWTEILGPYTHDKGIYYAAGFSMTADREPQWRRDMQKAFAEKLERNPEVYDHIVATELSVPERTTIAPPGTVDRVLTFRNVHNWMKGEYAEGVFAAMYRALKPGGILGVVEHRAKPGTDLETMIRTGYVTEAHVIELAEKAGFSLLDRSEINANKKDTTDHPAGVWTLPPSLRHCSSLAEEQQAPCLQKYRAIGESDRMTLKFVKPK
ncbi:MAG: methyltransferase [Pseudomonadales bacterium]|nr:methyltransferase [Pseudomonadales bacterium]